MYNLFFLGEKYNSLHYVSIIFDSLYVKSTFIKTITPVFFYYRNIGHIYIYFLSIKKSLKRKDQTLKEIKHARYVDSGFNTESFSERS